MHKPYEYLWKGDKMKKVKQLIWASFFAVCCFFGVTASANEYDFFETATVENKELIEEKQKEQKENAEKFKETLGECATLEYSSEVITNTYEKGPVTVETNEEKEKEINNLEEEGYTTSLKVTYDDSIKSNYEFKVLNNKIVEVTINSVKTDKYNGKDITDVLKSFVSEETDDYKIVVSEPLIENNTEINEEIIKTSEKEAKDLVLELQKQGYKATYEQNNTKVSNKTIVSRDKLTNEEIKEELEKNNSNKEIKDINITTTEPSTYESEKYSNEKDASLKKEELKNEGIYELVFKKVTVDESKKNVIKNEVKYTGSEIFTLPYTEYITAIDEETNQEITIGYRNYYEKSILKSEASSVSKKFLTEQECTDLKNKYNALGYTASCTKVTKTEIEESEDDKYYFNDTKQSTRTWSHLDISVEQNINIYNEDGTIKDTVKGQITNLKGYKNKGTQNEKTIIYNKSATSDNGRLEYRSKTDSSFKNTDLITLYATVTYTYNGKTITKDIVLEGYLKNDFNVCRERNKIGGGFDLELSISVDKDGNHIINFVTKEVWSFDAFKDAEYSIEVYYDEYEYETLYYVIAKDLDYTYNVSYVATDYTVSYNGTSKVYKLNTESYDKNFEIKGIKYTYTITTKGIITGDDTCGTGDIVIPEEPEITPPKTSIDIDSATINFSNKLIVTIDDKKRKRK